MDSEYIKALSVHNIADMVYAKQVFHEPGMLPGTHMTRMYDEILAIPDGSWIVWLASEGAIYTWLYDQQFKDKYIPYDELPPQQKAICDAHPSYEEWVEAMDQEFDRQTVEDQNNA